MCWLQWHLDEQLLGKTHFLRGCVLANFHLLSCNSSPSPFCCVDWQIVTNFDGNVDVFWLNLFLGDINSRLFVECLVHWNFVSLDLVLLTRIRQLSSSVHELNPLILLLIFSGHLNIIDSHGEPHVFGSLRQTLDTLEHRCVCES